MFSHSHGHSDSHHEVHAHAHFHFELIDEADPELVLVEIQTHSITDPTHSAELSHQLDLLIRPEFPKQFVLDFHKVRLFCSTAFGAVFSFVRKVKGAGGRVKICGMDEFVRFGADVIRLGEYAEFADSRDSALQDFLDNGTPAA
jgi:anti-anti-sigma regulatory factor